MQDGGPVQYQTYPQPAHVGPGATSTKVVNLSRAQLNLGQPSQNSPQTAQTYYAQPSQQQSPMTHSGSFQPMSPQPQGYQATQYVAPPQPQVFTVGSTQPMPQQQVTQYRVIPSPQQQQYPQPQTPDANRAFIYTGGQPNVVNQASQVPYGQQPGQPQMRTQQYTVVPQSHMQYQQPQSTGQIVFAQSAVPTQMQPQQPSPITYQTQPSSPGGTFVAFQPANQQPAQIQPTSVQPNQQWVSPPYARPAANISGSVQSAYQVPSSPTPPTPSQSGQTPVHAQQVIVGGQVKQAGYPTQQRQPQQQQSIFTSPGYQAQPQTQFSQQQQQQPEVKVYQQQSFQTRPPIPPSQADTQASPRRAPFTGGPARNIKVRSLPMRRTSSMDSVDVREPPQFTQQPINQVNVNEGDPASVSVRVRPAGDSSLRVEWFKNGKPLAASSRFSTVFDRGYAVLEFIYTNEDDTGDYSCVATNSYGQDQSSSCRITVIPEEGVITESQLPEESMIANLAAMENQMMQNGYDRDSRYRDETKVTRPPQFLKPLSPQVGLRESAPAHFETILEPANDSSLVVEWFKDGKPVSMGCRFNAILDRGFAILDILYCYPEDNGAYWCVARNSMGQVQSNVVELQCTPEASIVTNSVLSKDSVSYLQSLDNWGSDQMAGYDRPKLQEEEEAPSAPSFDILPEALTVTEGSPARFLVKAGGYPRPKIFWYIDGELLASTGGGGNWHIYQDGGISHLEFNRAGTPNQHHIRAVAKNNMGEVAVDTTLVIEPQLDFRPDLRHVQPENPFKKLAQLKKVERTSELDSAFSKPRPQAIDLRRLERESEHKARNAAGAETLEVENLYSRVQAQLRTSRRTSLPPPTPPAQAPVRQYQPPAPAQATPTRQQRSTEPPLHQSIPQQIVQPPTKQPVVPPTPPPPPPPPPAPSQPPMQAKSAPIPPPPPPPATPPAFNAGIANQSMNSAMNAQTELLHDEISADFTIQL